MFLTNVRIAAMKSELRARRAERGAFLLEALIGILIFSLGILGIVGLQAQAIRSTNDAEYRAQAVYLANSLISQMWADNRNTLKANYDSAVGGPKYTQFTLDVQNGMLGAIFPAAPIVKVDVTDGSLPLAVTKTSSVVQVQIFWRLPGETATTTHNYITTGVIGQN
jgi:type IV pilus assembly protein PilV